MLQELVDADRAGVLFTRNPLDGADEVVVEAAWGLGEGVVEGIVTPDRFRVRRDGTLLERAAGVKDIAVVRAPEGGTRQAADRRRPRPDALPDAIPSSPSWHSSVGAASSVFGKGRDIEWAYADGALHLLQCRPITRAAAPR